MQAARLDFALPRTLGSVRHDNASLLSDSQLSKAVRDDVTRVSWPGLEGGCKSKSLTEKRLVSRYGRVAEAMMLMLPSRLSAAGPAALPLTHPAWTGCDFAVMIRK